MRYDAVSGKPLGSTPIVNKASQTVAPKYVDGFRRTSQKTSTGGSKPVATPTVPKVTKSVSQKTHTPGMHVAAHKPEPAKTLMRSAVKKPDIKAPSVLKAVSRTDLPANLAVQAITPKASAVTINPKRLKKAAQMVKSPSVSRYGQSGVLPAASTALVAAAPASKQDSIAVIQQSLHGVSSAKTVPHIPVSPVHAAPAKTDIFTEALANARSHEQTHEPSVRADKKRRRVSVLATATLSLLLIVGVVAYTNTPALSMRVASMKAGFSAKLPDYSPAGFNFGTLSYGRGNVTVSYASAQNAGLSYDITQRASNWNSQTLLDNFVQTANKAYQTYQQAGRTIYMYGDNTATWVDSGVWYTVNGNSALSRDQILDLARSL